MARAEQRFAAAGSRRADAMVLEDNGQGQAAWGRWGTSRNTSGADGPSD